MNSLPLSWSIIDSDKSYSKTINRWNIKWHALQDIPSSNLIFEFEKDLETKTETIIRGCNLNFSKKLKNAGFSSVQIGMEAVLDTRKDHFKKKSLKYLIKRGKRHGKVIRLPYSDDNIQKLAEFQKISVHGSEPQLQYLFQTEFKKNNSLFVFIDDKQDWFGAILLSENSIDKLHTELILRRKAAPTGIMEVLIEYVFNEAKKQNITHLSLGEVPFSANDLIFDDTKSLLVIRTGRLLNFAYNYKGLYNFKNKFQPNWEKLYICSSTKVKIKHLLFILIHSNFHKLIAHKMLYRLKNICSHKNFNTRNIFIPKQLDFNKT